MRRPSQRGQASLARFETRFGLRFPNRSSTPHLNKVSCVVMSLVDDDVAECRQDVCAKLHHRVGVGR
jgi:hypothetical protein